MGSIKTIVFLSLAVLACAMGAVLWWHNAVFLIDGPENGFLLTKAYEVRYSIYLPAFYIHIVTASLVLILGAFQLSGALRRRYAMFHHMAGKVYIFTILIFTAPSGLIMSWNANGGVLAQSGFALLAILWWLFTLMGLKYALRKNWDAHRKFMLRSYALTFAAVTLRLYSFLFALAGFHGESVYHLIVWLCWVPSLIVVELYLMNRNRAASATTSR